MKQLVYDLPTRAFHWLFAALFVTAIVITKVLGDESPVFTYHMLAGLTLGFLVLLRLVWGFLGTKHARFSDFALNPLDLLRYFKGIITGDKRRWAGHNPASSWAAAAMIALAIGLCITGFLITSGAQMEGLDDIHEILANSFLVIAILHICGIALHTFRHRELIGLSMVDGKKADIDSRETIASSYSAFGILLIALVASFGLYLFKNYDEPNGQLNLFGKTLQLGDSEMGEEGSDDHED